MLATGTVGHWNPVDLRTPDALRAADRSCRGVVLRLTKRRRNQEQARSKEHHEAASDIHRLSPLPSPRTPGATRRCSHRVALDCVYSSRRVDKAEGCPILERRFSTHCCRFLHDTGWTAVDPLQTFAAAAGNAGPCPEPDPAVPLADAIRSDQFVRSGRREPLAFEDPEALHTAHTPTVSAWSNTGSVRSVRSAPRLGNLPRSPGPRAQADRTTDRMNLDVRDRRRRSLDCRFRGIWGNFAGVCPGKREG
jgi:hypothetical protein